MSHVAAFGQAVFPKRPCAVNILLASLGGRQFCVRDVIASPLNRIVKRYKTNLDPSTANPTATLTLTSTMLRLQFFRARLLVSSARAFSSSAARPSFISRKDNQDLPSTTQGHAVDKDDPKDVQSENARAGIEDKKNQRTSAAASAQGEDKKPGSETASPNKAPGGGVIGMQDERGSLRTDNSEKS
ncbi:hypothetical protein G7K_4514-t1 [Saitoella complicata NRRL Y-17804]|uniref:Uncharacterized protein n=1 Tax=Saitoella complicata (strain BCRC 22490 / CBS 7301 / JCM 7358 / NBRC 10748 / NRRL Y-17804) TaxID=698492 RepID=A0A0E9NKS0_SAICN|nr:hypothetical protein G7K_4514-t1 [Saitoella complicata NRRL Y-17804]